MSDFLPVEPLPAIDRDRFGRPMVIPPDGGKPTPYTRCTTFVGVLEDTYNLGLWQQRMVAHGLSIRPDLLLRVNSLGTEPPKTVPVYGGNYALNPAYRPWVDAMNEACEAAKEAASAHAKATIGTSLHAIAERLDKGESPTIVPDYLPHMAAYADAVQDWEWLHIERFMVNDTLKIGGTPDRVAIVPGHPHPVIADLKTGDTTYGVGKMAMQLAVYAHSRIYDPTTGKRESLPDDIDLEMGLIIALDATTGTCDILRIDIAAGWVAVQLAAQVRAWRAHRGLTEPWQPKRYPWQGMSTLDGTANQALIAAIQQAASVDELTALWATVTRGAWLDVHTQHAARRKRQLTTT